jgi:hypothetical protein
MCCERSFGRIMRTLPGAALLEQMCSFQRSLDGAQGYRDAVIQEFAMDDLSAPTTTDPFLDDRSNDIARERPW